VQPFYRVTYGQRSGSAGVQVFRLFGFTGTISKRGLMAETQIRYDDGAAYERAKGVDGNNTRLETSAVTALVAPLVFGFRLPPARH